MPAAVVDLGAERARRAAAANDVQEESASESSLARWMALDREQRFRLMVWRNYERHSRDGDRCETDEIPESLDELEADRWSNEVVSYLRDGVGLRVSIGLANVELSDGFGPEESPLAIPGVGVRIGVHRQRVVISQALAEVSTSRQRVFVAPEAGPALVMGGMPADVREAMEKAKPKKKSARPAKPPKERTCKWCGSHVSVCVQAGCPGRSPEPITVTPSAGTVEWLRSELAEAERRHDEAGGRVAKLREAITLLTED